jgi:hypothetical protein
VCRTALALTPPLPPLPPFTSPSPQPLGTVTRVRLAHNNFGTHPDWHVRSVEVSEYSNPLADVRVFEINQWLSMEKDNCRWVAASCEMWWRRGDWRVTCDVWRVACGV